MAKPTLKDIAAFAGDSIIIVSHILNGEAEHPSIEAE